VRAWGEVGGKNSALGVGFERQINEVGDGLREVGGGAGRNPK